MKKRYLQILFYSFILTACNLSTNELSDGSLDKININVDNIRKLNLSEISNEISYINLESNENCIIGKIDKIIFNEKYIVVVDKVISKSIFIFNAEGAFLNKINKKGGGPGEFIDIGDVNVTDVIELYDSKMKKILQYDIATGSFLHDIDIGRVFLSFMEIDSTRYIIHTNKMNNLDSNNKLIEYDILICAENGKVIEKYFEYDPKLKTSNTSYDLTKVFTEYGKNIYINKLLDNSIYLLRKEQQLEKVFEVDYNGNGVPESYQVLPSGELIEKLITDNEYAFAHCLRAINDNFILFTFSYENLMNEYWGIYDKKDKSTEVYSTIINDVDSGVFPMPITMLDSNILVSIIDPIKIQQQVKNNEIVIPDEHPIKLGKDSDVINQIIMLTTLK